MIWEKWSGLKGVGTKKGTFSKNGSTYDINTSWANPKGINASWHLVQFLRRNQRTSGQVDVLAFVRKARDVAFKKGDSFITAVEFGSEPTKGKRDVTLNTFYITHSNK